MTPFISLSKKVVKKYGLKVEGATFAPSTLLEKELDPSRRRCTPPAGRTR